MRINIISDIHLEFGKENHKGPECDVVVAAGDLSPGVAGIMWLAEQNGKEKISIAGNHEFYGKRALHHHYEKLKAKSEMLGTTFLQNNIKIIGDVRFVGATLWTDFNLNGNSALDMLRADNVMNDYKQIRIEKDRRFTINPLLILAEHQASLSYIRSVLETPFAGKTVVITHHAPCSLSLEDRYKSDQDSCFYASRLENFIFAYEPTLWIHGHIHEPKDYNLGNTRVVCNPRGYIESTGRRNDHFNRDFIVEL